MALYDVSKVGESGRKSASADDEETGEAIRGKNFTKMVQCLRKLDECFLLHLRKLTGMRLSKI